MLDEERNKHQVYCTSKIFFKQNKIDALYGTCTRFNIFPQEWK